MSTKKKSVTTLPMEDLLGPVILTNVEKKTESTSSVLKGKDLVLVYFSAS
jgi:hypothetical protein